MSATAVEVRAARTRVPKPADRPGDAELGMAWWNRLTRIERMDALNAAGTSVPAEAWRVWRLRPG